MRTPAKLRQGSITKPAAETGRPFVEGLHAQPAPGKSKDKDKAARREWRLCVAIALVFSAWGLRTVGSYNVIETDAARHAMNGVFLHDLIARGKITDVLTFARSYYGHLPALSLPYHPPLFPLIEAVFFSLLGVNALAARLAVAIAVFAVAVGIFRLVLAIHRSSALAALSTITFLCLPEALWLGSDVMLEFPALAFTLLAIHRLQPVDGEYTMRRALWFAALASAAVWTKQQTVFLGAVPFVYVVSMGRWRFFRKAPIWVSTGLFILAVGALAALSLPFHGAGVNQAIPGAAAHFRPMTYSRLIIHHLRFYFRSYPEITGPAGVILILGLAGGVCCRLFPRRILALYASWILPSVAVLLVIRPYATRYLFFTYPALIALGYAGLIAVVERLSGRRRWAIGAAAAVTVVAVVQFPFRTQILHGPEEAARVIAAAKPSRVLYCGGTDGNFIFHYRALQPGLETTIIPGDKLPADIFTAAGIEAFAHDYGVKYIVLEDAEGLSTKRPWLPLLQTPSPSMVPEQDIHLVSSGRWNGLLRIYRFTNPSPNPKDFLSMRMFMIGGTMDFQLGQ